MKMPNQRAHGLLQRTGYGGIDGNARPQPTANSFRNASMHQPRHPVEADTEQRANGETHAQKRMQAEGFKRGGRTKMKEGSAAEERGESKAFEATEDEGREGRKRGGRTVVNVNVHGGNNAQHQQEKKQAAMQGLALGARLAQAKMAQGAGGPPMAPDAGPGPGAPMPSGPGPAPMPGMKRGGGLG